jgi:hypothetical protein
MAIDSADDKFISYYDYTDGMLKLASEWGGYTGLNTSVVGQVYDNVTGQPINGALVSIYNNTHWTTNTSFDYLGFIPGVYIFDKGVAPSSAYKVNATKTGYFGSGELAVTSGTVGTSVQKNIPLGPQYTLILNIRDVYSQALIADRQVNIILTNPTTGGIIADSSTPSGVFTTHLIPYGVITANVSALGYYPSLTSYAITGDLNATVYLTNLQTAQWIINTMYPKDVRFICVDRFGNKLQWVNVSATMTSSSIPNSSTWWQTMLGLGPTISPALQTSTLYGITDSGGSVVFPMVAAGNYQMSFINATQGISENRQITPQQDSYTIWLMTTATAIAPTCGNIGNASLFVYAPTADTVYLNLSYNDPSSTTKNVTFFINFPNQTPWHIIDYYGPAPDNQTVNANWTVPNVAGTAFVFGYFINTSTCGNYSAAQGITLKGIQGQLINLDPCSGYALGWDSAC